MFKRLAVIVVIASVGLVLIACEEIEDSIDNTLLGQASGSEALPASWITIDNVSQIQPLARLGPGGLYDIGLLDGGRMLAAVAENGIGLYQADDLTPMDFLSYKQDPFADAWPGPLQYFGTSSLEAEFAGSTVSFVWEEQQWIIDVMTGEQRVEPAPADYEAPEPVTTSPDGQWEISSERDPQTFKKIFVVQNTQTGAEWNLERANCGGFRTGFGTEFSPDGTRLYTATGVKNGVVSAWDLETGDLIATVGGFGVEVWDLAFDQQGKLLVVQGESNIQVQAIYCPDERNPGSGLFAYDLASGTSTMVDLPGVNYPFPVAFSADGRFMVVKDGSAIVTVWEDGEQVAAYELKQEWVNSDDPAYRYYPPRYTYYVISPDGAYIAAMNWGELVVWDWAALRNGDDPRLVFELHLPNWAWDMIYLPTLELMAFDGTTLVFADSDQLRFVDVPAGDELEALSVPPILHLAYANHMVAVQMVGAETLQAVFAATGAEVDVDNLIEVYGIPRTPTAGVWRLGDSDPTPVSEFETAAEWLTLSPDGTLLVATNRVSMSFFEAKTGRLLHTIETDISLYQPPVFSPDGSALIIAPGPPKRSIGVWGIPAE